MAQVFEPEFDEAVKNMGRLAKCKLCTRELDRHGAGDECYPTPPKAWTPPPATSPAYQVIPPDMFLELGQGSRDRDVLAMEEAISEDILKLDAMNQVPALERFVKDIQIVLDSLRHIEKISKDGINIHPRMTIHDTINRSVHRGEVIVATNTSRRISEALATLDKSLKALEQRKNNGKE